MVYTVDGMMIVVAVVQTIAIIIIIISIIIPHHHLISLHGRVWMVARFGHREWYLSFSCRCVVVKVVTHANNY